LVTLGGFLSVIVVVVIWSRYDRQGAGADLERSKDSSQKVRKDAQEVKVTHLHI
jgi:hypothetical protein